ncbi:Hyaluronan synthase [Exiguobacterium sp. 8H]|uniref:glycosyltransferase family 2 protein n=1 Tax=unclassified Exiguobacterium TaxID=2644629 RepID=UPI0012F1AEC6|nr:MULTISPECIES: glycosyltransferase family 2 protein [unclassified Exiguobacterium]VXB83821.1 Hyaluronan synthase [Exiguobacterium sp. 8H]VXB96962.1 Hyaluronan synthase [Exiguobacterium sp. 8A]
MRTSRKARQKRTGGKQRKETYVIFVVFVFIVIFLVAINLEFRGGWDKAFGVYGSIMITYLIGKMLLSFLYKPYINEPGEHRVSVIIPSYNEKPKAVLGIIESIIKQDYPIAELFFVDDGSKDDSGYLAVLEYKQKLEMEGELPFKFVVHRLEENKGKRHAQIWAFQRATGDIFFTVDSDGYTYPDALRELLRPFVDPDVMAVTGHINARNRDYSYFTKLLDMRYDNAFRVERAAQSVTGNILVCSGPISCYRREVVLENIEHYGNQKFLGEVVQTGDDRCLTNYAILKGKTVYQSGARCDTDVPETLRQFLKQQVRWNKSFFRETLIAFSIGLKKPVTLVWVMFEMTLWLLFGFIVVVALLFKVKSFGLIMLSYYLIAISLSAYARNVHYIVKRPLIFLMAPLYGIIHLVLLFPLRFYALFTLKETKWGTR